MRRKEFIRNTLLGFAALLLPEVLRPMDSVVKEEQAIVCNRGILWYIETYGNRISYPPAKPFTIEDIFNFNQKP